MNIKKTAADIVSLIVNDIRTNGNAAPLKDCWSGTDPEVRGMIRAAWANEIEACLRENLERADTDR